MKRILMLFLIGIIGSIGIACSSDDNTTIPIDKAELFLKVSRDTIKEGEPISFTIFDKQNKALEASIYVDGNKVDKTHAFTKKGTYYAIAKKENYHNSFPVAITVLDKNEQSAINQLELSTPKTTITYGETVKFNVSADGHEIKDAKVLFYQGKALNTNEWTPTRPGKYKFVASKLNFATSEVLEITVVLKSTVEDQTITINGNKFTAHYTLADFVADKNSDVILFHDSISAYYVFYTLVDNSGPIFVNCFLKVRVPRNTIIPSYSLVFDQSRVSLLGAKGYNDLLKDNIDIDINGFTDKTFINIQKPNNGTKGQISLEFYSKDHSVEAKYSGEYNIENIVGETFRSVNHTKVKTVNREFSFDDVKYLNR